MKTKLFVLATVLISVIGVFAFPTVAQAAIPEQGGDFPQNVCKNLWWRDDSHPTCSQKEFCGTIQYGDGLYTSETQSACQSAAIRVMHQDFFNPTPQSWYVNLIEKIRLFFARFFPVQQRNTPSGNPNPTPPEAGKFCGGIAANLPQNQCPSGYKCQLDGKYPDAGGKCVPNRDNSNRIFTQIAAAYPLISEVPPYPSSAQSLASPDGKFVVENKRSMSGETTILLTTKDGQVIADDLLKSNYEAIGYNKKFSCQCDTRFLGWFDSNRFVINIINGAGEVYEYLVAAKSGQVDENSFRRVK